MYTYYLVKAIAKRDFLLRVEVCDDATLVLENAVKMAEAYIGQPNFNIKEATMEDIFGFEYNVVDLVPVIVNLN